MFNSLKIQITLVLTALIVFLVAQSYLSTKNQDVFLSGITLSQQTMEKVGLVRDLEKDVLDIQRYVLIFKQTAGDSVIGRFNLLYDEISSNLSLLETLVQPDINAETYSDRISRMRAHLEDYKSNFENVVAGRSRRDELFNNNLEKQFTQIQNTLTSYQSDPLFSEAQHNDILTSQVHLAMAHSKSVEYLLHPDLQLISLFDKQIMQTQDILFSSSENQLRFAALEDELNMLRVDFKQLTQVTRGYLFLVNVVMAGSANEFLYLTREINQLVTDNQQQINKNVIQSGEDAKSRNSIFAAISVALAAITALFFTYRVMLPISEMTTLFKSLASGQNLAPKITPRQNNEIGELAIAAQVFHEKNIQTQYLLKQSKQLNAAQEKLNKELALSSQKAEQAVATKGMFLANMSHEIRTPMNGIIGLVDMVLKTDLNKSQRANLEKVVYSTHILLNLINDILDFSKIEAGKLDIENVRFSPKSMFENLLANISVKGTEKNLNIQFTVNPNLPLELIGDPMRINQILLNLCTNAVKFTRNGSVLINIDFAPIDPNNICLKVCVEDTGIGMDEAQLKNIFAAFTQADGSTSRKFGGTGLGLSIVKQLVELMGGKISVESSVNQGSRFDVEIVLAAENPENIVMGWNLPVAIAYVCVSSENLTPYEYLQRLDKDYRTLRLDQIEEFDCTSRENSLVILDVDGIETHKILKEHIANLLQKGAKVGLVTNTQPSTLPSLLTQKWNVPVLSHPFTPRHFKLFVQDVLGVEVLYNNSVIDEIVNVPMKLSGHILLVEDNHINQIVAGEILTNLGLTYDIAEDGQQAVTKIINSPQYDVILMDIQMPIMDGYEATKILRKQGLTELVICGLSANAMKTDYETAYAAGMNDYITKPIKAEMLNKVLAKYLPENQKTVL